MKPLGSQRRQSFKRPISCYLHGSALCLALILSNLFTAGKAFAQAAPPSTLQTGGFVYYTDFMRGVFASGTPIHADGQTLEPGLSGNPCPTSAVSASGSLLSVTDQDCATRDANTRYLWSALTDSSGVYQAAYPGCSTTANPLMKDLYMANQNGAKISFHIQALIAYPGFQPSQVSFMGFDYGTYTGSGEAYSAYDQSAPVTNPTMTTPFYVKSNTVYAAVPFSIVNDDSYNGWFVDDVYDPKYNPKGAWTIFYVPDWNNPKFLQAATQLLNSIRQDINNCGLQNAVGFVNIGMYGNYGENENGGLPYFPNAVNGVGSDRQNITALTPAAAVSYVDMHVDAFGDKQLIAQLYQPALWMNAFARPYTGTAATSGYPLSTSSTGIKPSYAVGWRADCFGHEAAATSTTAAGACYNEVSNQGYYDQIVQGLTSSNTDASTLVQHGWTFTKQYLEAPVMLELYGPSADEKNPNLAQYAQNAHASALNELNFFDGNGSAEPILPLITSGLMDSLGYNFSVSATASCNQNVLTVTSTWSNGGSAPTYKSFDDWRVHWLLYPSGGTTPVADSLSAVQLSCMPSDGTRSECTQGSTSSQQWVESFSVPSCQSGMTLATKVVDPTTYRQQRMILNMTTQIDTGIYSVMTLP